MTRRRPDAVPAVGDVVGVPFLPSGTVSAVAGRLRAGVGRIHRAMAPAPVQVLEALFGLLDHGGLVALCELGVPDALDRATPVPVLARRLGIEVEPLERVLRYAAARGWVRLDRRGRAAPNTVTRFLRRDHPGGWRAWVDFAGGEEVVHAVGSLAAATRSGGEAFALVNGSTFFEWMAAHPDRGRIFDGAMAAGGRLHGLVLAAALDWSGSRRVCDVGGGTGSLLRTLLSVEPHLTGVVLDLPDVVGRAPAAARMELVAGDAFEQVPPGCDTYLLVNVLHDWSDDDAVRLLHRVAADGAPGARVVVVEGERRRGADDIPVRTDLLMLALTPGGRERTTAEMAELGRRAGLTGPRTVPLASVDLAHVFTTS